MIFCRPICGARALALLCGASVALAACPGTTTSSGLPRDELRRKLLQYQESKFHQRQFFVGIAHGATLEQATESASAELTRQLTWLPSGSQGLLRGMYRVDRSATDTEGNVHVLAVLEREAAAAHLRKLCRDAEASASIRLVACRTQLRAGEVSAAQACLAAATEEVTKARDLLAASRAAVGDLSRRSFLAAEEEANALAKELSTSQATRRSVLVRVLKRIDGRISGDLDAEFAAVCTNAGLKRTSGVLSAARVGEALGGSTDGLLGVARAAGAGYVLIGEMAAQFSSEDSGQFFSFAVGSLRLIETTGGRSVAELSCKDVKGGHISRRQASDKAIGEAAAQLKRELQSKLASLGR
jgi:hypothetical protein